MRLRSHDIRPGGGGGGGKLARSQSPVPAIPLPLLPAAISPSPKWAGHRRTVRIERIPEWLRALSEAVGKTDPIGPFDAPCDCVSCDRVGEGGEEEEARAAAVDCQECRMHAFCSEKCRDARDRRSCASLCAMARGLIGMVALRTAVPQSSSPSPPSLAQSSPALSPDDFMRRMARAFRTHVESDELATSFVASGLTLVAARIVADAARRVGGDGGFRSSVGGEERWPASAGNVFLLEEASAEALEGLSRRDAERALAAGEWHVSDEEFARVLFGPSPLPPPPSPPPSTAEGETKPLPPQSVRAMESDDLGAEWKIKIAGALTRLLNESPSVDGAIRIVADSQFPLPRGRPGDAFDGAMAEYSPPDPDSFFAPRREGPPLMPPPSSPGDDIVVDVSALSDALHRALEPCVVEISREIHSRDGTAVAVVRVRGIEVAKVFLDDGVEISRAGDPQAREGGGKSSSPTDPRRASSLLMRSDCASVLLNASREEGGRERDGRSIRTANVVTGSAVLLICESGEGKALRISRRVAEAAWDAVVSLCVDARTSAVSSMLYAGMRMRECARCRGAMDPLVDDTRAGLHGRCAAEFFARTSRSGGPLRDGPVEPSDVTRAGYPFVEFPASGGGGGEKVRREDDGNRHGPSQLPWPFSFPWHRSEERERREGPAEARFAVIPTRSDAPRGPGASATAATTAKTEVGKYIFGFDDDGRRRTRGDGGGSVRISMSDADLVDAIGKHAVKPQEYLEGEEKEREELIEAAKQHRTHAARKATAVPHSDVPSPSSPSPPPPPAMPYKLRPRKKTIERQGEEEKKRGGRGKK